MSGLPWIPLDVAFPTSRKAIALGVTLQEPLAWAYVVRLWTWAAQHAADGRIEGPDAVAVLEHAAGWAAYTDDRAGAFAAALLLPHIRLLDETPSGFLIHDWEQHCGAHVEKREKERLRLRLYRKQKRTGTERVPNKDVRGERESKREREKEEASTLPAAAPTASGRWPLGEQLRRLVAQGLANTGGLTPPTSAEERDRLEADLAKVGVETAAASCIDRAKSKGRGAGISSLRYFLAHVHEIAEPAAALPAQRPGKPLAFAPAMQHTQDGEVEL